MKLETGKCQRTKLKVNFGNDCDFLECDEFLLFF